jgi:plastocyanin
MHRKTWGLALILTVCCAVGAQSATHLVTLSGTSFTPDSILIQPGDVVRWEVVSGVHTTTSGIGSAAANAGARWDVPLSGTGASYEHTFPNAGVFPYFCRPHEMFGMTGEIVVAGRASAMSTAAQAGMVVLLLVLGAVYINKRQNSHQPV